MDLLRQIDLVQDKVDLGQRQSLARYQDGLAPLRADMVDIEQRFAELEERQQRLDDDQAQPAALPEDVERVLGEIWLRVTQLDLFLTEMRRSYPALPAPERLAALPNGFGGLYPYFEDAFRGPVESVRERVASYVEELAALDNAAPVLDVGSGRGELLDLLAARGVDAYGIELIERDAEVCRSRGLDVRVEDAFAHLRAIPEQSLGAVTAIQFVEHLEPDDMVEFVGLAARAIRPGGLFIVETQNPENVVVGSSSFYLDPTHRRPVPPALLSFIVAARGFDGVEIRRLARPEQQAGLARPKPDEPWADAVAALVDVVNFHLFSPADYAVVGHRP
jgi:O-antigen chain-terminating methyltransferase